VVTVGLKYHVSYLTSTSEAYLTTYGICAHSRRVLVRCVPPRASAFGPTVCPRRDYGLIADGDSARGTPFRTEIPKSVTSEVTTTISNGRQSATYSDTAILPACGNPWNLFEAVQAPAVWFPHGRARRHTYKCVWRYIRSVAILECNAGSTLGWGARGMAGVRDQTLVDLADPTRLTAPGHVHHAGGLPVAVPVPRPRRLHGRARSAYRFWRPARRRRSRCAWCCNPARTWPGSSASLLVRAADGILGTHRI
jgi:hypothetical protein